MIKLLGWVFGLYGVIVFTVFMIHLTINLEEGLRPYDSFLAAGWTGLGWPVSLVAWLWS